MEYISTHVRQEIVEKYREINHCEGNSDSIEKAIFGDPANRIIVDEAIKAADEQVDLERFTQFSPGWYHEVVTNLPTVEKLFETGKVLENISDEPIVPELNLSRKTLVYLGVMILQAAGINYQAIDTANKLYYKVSEFLQKEE